MFQNATPLRISARWPPNISDEHVSCTAPATRNASLQILFKSHMHASVIETATKPQFLLTFGRVQNPLRLPHKTTLQRPKVVRTCFFSMFTSKCASRQSGLHFSNISISTSKSAPTLVFCTFWLRKVLCATTAGTFSTAQLPKVLRTPSVFNTFDFEMCFAPQRPLLFQHLNFQKYSESVVFLTSESASRHSGVEFFISHLPNGAAPAALASLLFDPPEPQNIGKKTQCFATLLPFRAPASSFFWLFLLFSSPLLFHFAFPSAHIVGSLTSKPPSIIICI